MQTGSDRDGSVGNRHQAGLIEGIGIDRTAFGYFVARLPKDGWS
jgi:hypothetical protein